MNTDKDNQRRKTRDRVRKHRALHKMHNIPSESKSESESQSEPEEQNVNLETGGTHAQELDSHDNIGKDPSESPYHDLVSPTEAAGTDHDRSSCGSDRDDTFIPDRESIANDGLKDTLSQSADESFDEFEDESHEIRCWAIENNITHSQLDSLLLILRRRLLPNLPKTAKTFLKTSSATYDIKVMEDSEGNLGQFVYLGIADQIKACINPKAHPSNSIEMQINIDGLPLFKSSNTQLWPILFKIVHESDIYKPLPIAIYAGCAKPKDLNKFLTQFITEMNDLSANGILIDGKLFTVGIQCFICDTPARSLLKCTKGHTGYFACERCEVRGCRSGKCTVYPQVDCRNRTDESFRSQSQFEHHKGVSPLLQLWPKINMIMAFILDFMHLCCIGVMKKLLKEFWLYGNLYIRFSRRARIQLSHRLEFLKPLVPCEFQRKPRSVAYIAKWKATELRFFLLYCGPVVLKGILSQRLYKHFLLFHAACRILCHPDLALKYNGFAKKYLISFVQLLKEFYGTDSQVMNAHNLIHLADDVKNFNCSLSKITAFPFENALGKLKQFVRTPNRPLAQICRRLHELSTTQKKMPSIPPLIKIIKQSRQNDEATNRKKILKLKFRGYSLSTNSPDDTVLLKSGTILKIEYMTYCEESPGDITIYGKKWKIKRPLLTYPCNSKILESWVLDATFSASKMRCSLDDVQRKMVVMRLPYKKSEAYATSLLHN